ncbi:MAG TPA: TonB-dependent receptor, partial [Bacteroidetes bacterium]|nr:TonB-dependent receptor [Bacteroidota bacterium]
FLFYCAMKTPGPGTKPVIASYGRSPVHQNTKTKKEEEEMSYHVFKRFLFVLATAVFFLPEILILAQTQEKKPKEEQIVPKYEFPPIVVTATRTPKSVRDLSATVSVVTKEDIEASNATSCTDILNTLPGLFVQKTGDFGRADVDIRGLGERGRKVMVLVDGRPVKMGLFGCTITHSLPLDNVERIEVVRGPLSVLYGSDALGGVINIITRKPTKPLQMDYSFSYGNYSTYQHRLRAGGTKGVFSFYVTADKRKSNGHLPNSAYDGKDFTTRIGYQIGDNLEMVLTGKYFDGYKDEPLRATDPDTMISNTWNDYKRGAIDLSITGKLGNWNNLLKVYRNFGEHKFSDGWHSKDFTNGVVCHSSGKLFASNELIAGIEFRQQGGEKLNSSPGKWDKAEYAFFFHDEQILLRKLILTFGARYNQDEVAGGEFCPQIGLVFHPNKKTSLRGAINKGFRSPQINELYIFPPSNEDLKPEVVWSYELGFDHQIVEGINFDLVGYVMKGENLIQKEKNSSPPPMFRFENTGKFEFKGIETGLKARFGKWLSAQIYYTYLDPGEKTRGRPGDKLDLALRYAWKKLAFSFSAQYVADYFAADNRKEPIPDYFICNTKLNYKLVDGLQAFVAIDNILNKKYEIYVDLPGNAAGLYSMPKRNITIGLNFKL